MRLHGGLFCVSGSRGKRRPCRLLKSLQRSWCTRGIARHRSASRSGHPFSITTAWRFRSGPPHVVGERAREGARRAPVCEFGHLLSRQSARVSSTRKNNKADSAAPGVGFRTSGLPLSQRQQQESGVNGIVNLWCSGVRGSRQLRALRNFLGSKTPVGTTGTLQVGAVSRKHTTQWCRVRTRIWRR